MISINKPMSAIFEMLEHKRLEMGLSKHRFANFTLGINDDTYKLWARKFPGKPSNKNKEAICRVLNITDQQFRELNK